MENKKYKNELTIDGKAYQVKHPTEKMTTFSIGLYAGKKDGKAVYGFCKVVAFFNINLEDKEPVLIVGKLQSEVYTNKEGKNINSTVIVANTINGFGELNAEFPNTEVVDSKDDSFVDGQDIPF